MNERRFIYSANAVGVGANFGGSNSLRQFWASRALPIVGGIDPNRGEAGPSGHPVLNFTWAETKLSGMETTPGVHDTEVSATVKDLDILSGGITAELVSVTVKWRCDCRTGAAMRSVPAITGAKGLDPFVNLKIAGNPVKLDLDSALADHAALNYDACRKDLAEREKSITKNPRAGRPPFHTAFTHLVHLPNKQVRPSPNAPHEFGVVYNDDEKHPLPPGIERIYLCEWVAEPERQRLTIMRVKLAENLGEIVICDPTNGEDVP